jgi:hypothetical protein
MHDIFLPWDYPEKWRQRFYNEQYLLLTYLLGGADGDEIVLPVLWATHQPPPRYSGTALGARRPISGRGNGRRLLLDAARRGSDLVELLEV